MLKTRVHVTKKNKKNKKCHLSLQARILQGKKKHILEMSNNWKTIMYGKV